MINKKFEMMPAIILILISIVLAGCSNNAQPEVAKSDANQATTVSNNTNQSPGVLNNNIAAVNTPNASTPITVNTPGATVDNKKSSPPVKAPIPQIGSGGDDMFLFTQVRGALSSDKELSNAVIVEIKEGTATLTGRVSSETQKAKATQLVQGVQGIKSVKNNLRVSS